MKRYIRAARVLGISWPRSASRYVRHSLVWTLVLAAVVAPSGSVVAAGALTSASVALSDPRPGQTSAYTATGSGVDGATAIKCVKVIWATTATGDSAPAGFDGTSGSVTAASSTLINSSATGWSLGKADGTGSSGQKNIYSYTHSVGVTPSTTTGATFVMAGIVNSNVADTGYYLRLTTYTNTNCTAGLIDNATVQFINTNSSTLSLTIDQSLSFTVNSVSNSQSCNGATTTQSSTPTSLGFGSVTSVANGVVCQDLTAATNATHGYTIYARYTGAIGNGTDTIDDQSGSNTLPATFPGPGTEAYGYTTDDASLGTGTADRFTNPSQKWAPMTTSNAEIAYEASSIGATTYRIGHQVGVSITTPGGIYQTTIIYTCTPVY